MILRFLIVYAWLYTFAIDACILKQYMPYVTRGIVSHVLKLHLKSVVLSISLGKLSPT